MRGGKYSETTLRQNPQDHRREDDDFDDNYEDEIDRRMNVRFSNGNDNNSGNKLKSRIDEWGEVFRDHFKTK
jgi:hypothetical protein